MIAPEDRAESLLGGRWVPIAGHLVLLLTVVVLVRNAVPGRVLWGWCGIVVSLVFARAAWSAWARRRKTPFGLVSRATRVFMTGVGLAWGVGTILLARYIPLAESAIDEMALAGLLAGAINTLVADQWAFPLYALSLFGPTTVSLLRRATNPVNVVEAVLVAIFIVFMTLQHRRAHFTLLERLETESKLRENERQLASAQTIAHVGSWEWDIQGQTVTWSRELRRIFGLPDDAVAGYAEFLAVAHADDRPRLERIVTEGLASQQPIDYEWRAVQPDGTVRDILARNVVITDPTGAAIRLAGTALDITEHKLAAAQIKTLEGILPICASCKRIKNEDGRWQQMESYVREHTEAEFSHGLCPDCARREWGSAAS